MNRIRHPLLADRLRDARLAKGLTQTQAGALLFPGNKNPCQQWNAYEKGRITTPSEDMVQRMAQVVGIADWRELVEVGVAPGVQITEADVLEAYNQGIEIGRAQAFREVSNAREVGAATEAQKVFSEQIVAACFGQAPASFAGVQIAQVPPPIADIPIAENSLDALLS